MFNGAFTIPLGHQQLTLTTGTVGSLTLPTLPNALVGCLLSAEAQGVRYRDDNVAPTSSVGLMLRTTDPPLEILGLGNIKALKFIAAASGAILNVAYYQVAGR